MSRHAVVARCFAVVSFAAIGCGTTASTPPVVTTPPVVAATPVVTPAPLPHQDLPFSELFAKDGALRASELAERLAGQRVRMVGFMAEMEKPPRAAFYLTPRPVSCDEAGGGTADLPVESVLVSLPFVHDAAVPHVAGAVEVTGTFELGNQVDAEGFPSSFRIRLDPAPTQLSSVERRGN